MSPFARCLEVARQELAWGLRRPAYWVLFAVLALLAWGFSEGAVTISSGDSTVGGERAHVTSVFTQSMLQSVLIAGLGAWFLAIAAGLALIRDEELGVVEVLHSTRLSPAEYAWGKFAGAVGVFMVVWLAFLAASVFFNHLVAGSGSSLQIGDFSIGSYLYPTLLFGLPQILLFAGAPFFLGAWTRSPIIVFAFPVVVLMVTLTFLITWSPSWLSPDLNRALMLIDPSGYRWLNETFLKVDLGVEFYNTAALRTDIGFLLSRIVHAALGLAGVAGAARVCSRRLGQGGGRVRKTAGAVGDPGLPAPGAATAQWDVGAALRGLRMETRPPGFWKAAAAIGRQEVRDLARRPGMYLFVPLILFQSIQNTLVAVGPFGSPTLLTSGAVAARQMNTLSLLVCFLLLFYTVESLHREHGRRLAEIFNSTPIPTGSIILGKTLGNCVAAALVLATGVLASAAMVFYRQLFDGSPVAFDPFPFAATWGGVLIPTFIFWTALVTALFALLRNRYAVYGAGMALIIYTVYKATFGEDPLGWAFNWLAWDAVQWSDMGAFTLRGRELLLNRLLYLSMAAPLLLIAVKCFGRRSFDGARLLHRARPLPLLLGALRLLPFAAPALFLATTLHCGGRAGPQGPAARADAKDYWRANRATWTGFEMPSVSRVDLDLDFEPAEHSATVKGEYVFFNHRDRSYEQLPVTIMPRDSIEWTLDGEPAEPDDRANLFVFDLDQPLAPGDSASIGFAYELRNPRGMSRSAGGAGAFILESGIVLTAFSPNFVPVPGYLPDIGVDSDNSSEPRDYPDDFFEGETEPLFGWGGKPFTVRTRIATPEEYTANAVGIKTSDEVADGRRTVVWETDHPVGFFNVVAGKYAVKEGDGTAIYHHPAHDYNIDEMSAALDAARKHYSEWFHPFPWEVLKISEFPAFATYAQGFPTNITFSEGIGFLAKSDPRSHVAFMVVAHEAAHQWWGNLLTPGRGPGGNILSEGMSHYSTILLHEQVYGDRYRIEFTKRIEEAYGDARFVDSERPMVETDGSRDGDGTVTYNKGGWVMWMLQQEMGRDNLLAGLRAFIAKYNPDPDFPVLQDMLAVLRPFAPDTAAFDAFADQWFFDVVVPEYKFSNVTKTQEDDGAWVVRGTVENAGAGRMHVQVGATAGERWPDEDDDSIRTAADSTPAEAPDSTGAEAAPDYRDAGAIAHQLPEWNYELPSDAPDYRDARATVHLGAGESAEFVIRADFDPERVLIDPDVLVLQLNREAAVFSFEN